MKARNQGNRMCLLLLLFSSFYRFGFGNWCDVMSGTILDQDPGIHQIKALLYFNNTGKRRNQCTATSDRKC